MIITTNIRLPQEQLKALKIMAVHAGTSVSALLQQAVAQVLQGGAALSPSSKEIKRRTSLARRDPFFDVIGLGSGGPPDDSSRHDVYLYKKK